MIPDFCFSFAVQEALQSTQQAGRDAQNAMDAINKELMEVEVRISKLAAAEVSARQAAEAEEEQVCAASLSCQPSLGHSLSLGRGRTGRSFVSAKLMKSQELAFTSDCHCRRRLSNANSRIRTEQLDRHSKRLLLLPCAIGNFYSMSSSLRCTHPL